MQNFDAVVIGAGAAGLFCAAIAGQRGVKVLLDPLTASLTFKRCRNCTFGKPGGTSNTRFK